MNSTEDICYWILFYPDMSLNENEIFHIKVYDTINKTFIKYKKAHEIMGNDLDLLLNVCLN